MCKYCVYVCFMLFVQSEAHPGFIFGRGFQETGNIVWGDWTESHTILQKLFFKKRDVASKLFFKTKQKNNEISKSKNY